MLRPVGSSRDGDYEVVLLDHNVPARKFSMAGDAVGELKNLAFGVAKEE